MTKYCGHTVEVLTLNIASTVRSNISQVYIQLASYMCCKNLHGQNVSCAALLPAECTLVHHSCILPG